MMKLCSKYLEFIEEIFSPEVLVYLLLIAVT